MVEKMALQVLGIYDLARRQCIIDLDLLEI
jgi:hypothetical protein